MTRSVLRPCGHTEALLRDRLTEVRTELERLRALEADLTRLLEEEPQLLLPGDDHRGGHLVVRRYREPPERR